MNNKQFIQYFMNAFEGLRLNYEKSIAEAREFLICQRKLTWAMGEAPIDFGKATGHAMIVGVANELRIHFASRNVEPNLAPNETVLTRISHKLLFDTMLDYLRRYPDNGELYHTIIYRCYFEPECPTDEAIIDALHLERSTYYDRKREAIVLFAFLMFGGFPLPIKDLHLKIS